MSSPTKLSPWTIALTAVAIFMVSLDNLVVTNALASIRERLDRSTEVLADARERVRDDEVVEGDHEDRDGAHRDRPRGELRGG